MEYLHRLSLLHNPYTKPELAFLIENNITSIDSPLSYKGTASQHTTENGNLISHVEVVPHTQNPIISLALIMPIQLLFAASAIFIQIRTLQMLKQETSVNNSLMVTQAKLHILFWPAIVLTNTMIDNIYPLSKVFTPTFCMVFSFYMYFCAFSFILYSFYAALLRYLCCLHTEKVDKFGKNKLIALIYWIFYFHTFCWTMYNILTSFNLDHTPLINQCYGQADRVWLMEESLLHIAQRHFCGLTSSEGKTIKFMYQYIYLL